ncbi:MAG: hypothetical protein ACI4QT_01910 [Kiritimatiellia bacterium]
MKKLGLLASIVIATLFTGRLSADTTYSFTYQASLRDEHGNVITNDEGEVVRSHDVILRLWDSVQGGKLLWGKQYSIYTDETGVFNLAVSDETGSVINDAQAYGSLEKVFSGTPAGGVYVGIEVKDSSGEITPRQRLFAVPFAAVANDVRRISGDVVAGGNIQLGASGNVVINADGITQKTGGSEFNHLTVGGTLTVSGEITGTAGATINGKLTVNEDVEIAADKSLSVGGSEVVPVPVGGIIIWTKPELPDNEHWAVCDGSTNKNYVGKLPDLRARFVVGVNPANADYELNATGGVETVTLTTDQIPGHRHYYAGDDELEGIETTLDCTSSAGRTDKDYDADSKMSGKSKVYKTSSTGGGKSHENRPPYYALYYIMRVK